MFVQSHIKQKRLEGLRWLLTECRKKSGDYFLVLILIQNFFTFVRLTIIIIVLLNFWCFPWKSFESAKCSLNLSAQTEQ